MRWSAYLVVLTTFGCDSLRFDHAAYPPPVGGDYRHAGDTQLGDSNHTGDTIAGDTNLGDAALGDTFGDTYVGDMGPGDSGPGDEASCVANACGSCGCPGGVCHVESATCLPVVDDVCAPIELDSRLGTFVFDTGQFSDWVETLLCDSSCGSPKIPTPGSPDVILSWKFPAANTDFEFSAESVNNPFLIVMMFPAWGADEYCWGMQCCYDATSGPPYTFGVITSSSAAENRANIILETLDGSPGEITVRICEGSCS